MGEKHFTKRFPVTVLNLTNIYLICCSAQNSVSNGTTPSINGVDEDRSVTSPTHSVGNGGVNGFGSADSIQEQLMSEQSHSSEPEAEASSLIKLTNGDVLYLREVNRYVQYPLVHSPFQTYQ